MTNGSWNGQRRAFPRTMRATILRRDPTCQCPGCPACTTHGCGKTSTEADHIRSHAECLRAGINPDTTANGQGLCADCHRVKTRHEQAAGRARMKGKRPPRPHPSDR